MKLRLFVRQGFTETDGRTRETVQGVLDLLNRQQDVEIATGASARDGATFRQAFEEESGIAFSPGAFRRHRLALLRKSDAMVIIRTGLSESTAFEVAYNVGCGPGLPMLFAVHRSAPIRTTLLQGLDECVPATYAAFDAPEDLQPAVDEFLAGVRAAAGRVERRRNMTISIHGLDVPARDYADALTRVGPALAAMAANGGAANGGPHEAASGAVPVQLGVGVFLALLPMDATDVCQAVSRLCPDMQVVVADCTTDAVSWSGVLRESAMAAAFAPRRETHAARRRVLALEGTA